MYEDIKQEIEQFSSLLSKCSNDTVLSKDLESAYHTVINRYSHHRTNESSTEILVKKILAA
ncbi:MAG: hypothetical protein ACFBSE_17035, partial [Prochloraceae cyanobacterium]